MNTNTIKTLALSTLTTLAFSASSAWAMNAEEIIDTYYENTGGTEAWGDLKGVKMYAEVDQGGMKIPLEIVQMDDGRTYTKVTVQGKTLMQNVFDGQSLWSTNFMTMKAEKADSEATANMKLNANDFPGDLFNYDKKGYQAEVVGTETIDGAETYKIKLVKEPVTIDGKKVDDVAYYYFDKEALVPLVQESEIKSGRGKGMISQVKLSDFQEVEGLYFPFSISQGVKDRGAQPVTINKIELNPQVDESLFAFPEQAATDSAANASKSAPSESASAKQ